MNKVQPSCPCGTSEEECPNANGDPLCAQPQTDGMREDKWQPIETAPKDEMFIWAYRRDSRWSIGLAYRNVSGGWSCAYGSDAPRHATHWCPLPAPPSHRRRKSPQSPVMQAAEKAVKTVEGWPDAKRNYADRATGFSAITRPQTPAHSGTYLGYKNVDGLEMHCANAFCPHPIKCRKGCTSRVALPVLRPESK